MSKRHFPGELRLSRGEDWLYLPRQSREFGGHSLEPSAQKLKPGPYGVQHPGGTGLAKALDAPGAVSEISVGIFTNTISVYQDLSCRSHVSL